MADPGAVASRCRRRGLDRVVLRGRRRDNRGIQWTLLGVLSGSKKMQTVLITWVATRAVK
jgi:hypothetical protein